jgi:hypothetical protein
MSESIGKDVADGVDASLKHQLSDMPPNMRRATNNLRARVITESAVNMAVFDALSSYFNSPQDHADSALD